MEVFKLWATEKRDMPSVNDSGPDDTFFDELLMEIKLNLGIQFAFPSGREHRYKNPKNVIIGYLNVNSLRNKFVNVEELIKSKIDVCVKYSDTYLMYIIKHMLTVKFKSY